MTRCLEYKGHEKENEIDLYHIGIEYQEFKDKRHEQSKGEAFAGIDRIIDGLFK